MHFYEKEIAWIKKVYGKKDAEKAEKHVRHYLKHGWWDGDTWSAEASIARYALPLIKALRQRKLGYPSKLSPKKWKQVLDRIIWSLEQIANDRSTAETRVFDNFNKKHSKHDLVKKDKSIQLSITWDSLANERKWLRMWAEYDKKVQSGIDLMAKYFTSLWD